MRWGMGSPRCQTCTVARQTTRPKDAAQECLVKAFCGLAGQLSQELAGDQAPGRALKDPTLSRTLASHHTDPGKPSCLPYFLPALPRPGPGQLRASGCSTWWQCPIPQTQAFRAPHASPNPCPQVTETLRDCAPHRGLRCLLTHRPHPRTRWGDVDEGHSVGARVWMCTQVSWPASPVPGPSLCAVGGPAPATTAP